MTIMNAPQAQKTIKDFESDQEVRWCPGCGDYAILKSVQRCLADLDADPDQTVFISGIGCSSRLPYYMNTYGFHTIHGRAPAFATGLKLARPDLDIWVITGDGDALSIGGNHTLHALRRNIDIQILMFNNEIYGLTKGQYSPTSRPGTRSPSTPFGSIDSPVHPCSFALGSGACFVARGIDTAQKHLLPVLKRAREHRGASFVEIYQNCIVYNDAVFDTFTAKKQAADNQLLVQHGEPLIFGKDRNRGLVFDGRSMTLKIVDLEKGDLSEDDILVHDETNLTLASLLIEMPHPEFPVALGVIYCNPGQSYGVALHEQLDRHSQGKEADLNAMLRQEQTWNISD